MSKTGGGVSKGREATQLQFKIESFIGKSYIEGIPGTGICDTTLQSETLSAVSNRILSTVSYTAKLQAFVITNKF